MPNVSKALVFSEVMQSIRHYSSLRFAMMPVYITIAGGLAIAALTNQIASDLPLFKQWCWWAGLLTAVVFLLFEFALSFNLARLWNVAVRLTSEAGFEEAFPHRDPRLLWPIRFAWISIYLFGVIFWLCQKG